MSVCEPCTAVCRVNRSNRFPLERIQGVIRETLYAEDLGPIERMSELILVRMVLYEFAYWCQPVRWEEAKAYVLATLVPVGLEETKAASAFDVEAFRGFMQEDRGTPTDDDLLDAYFAVRKLAQASDGPPRMALIEWLREGWDNGVHQRRVREMEIEGGVTWPDAVIGNLACSLALFGQGRGLLPAPPA